MDLGSIFLILALLVAVAWFVSRPFFEPEKAAAVEAAPTNEADHERSALLAERDRALNALQELDFDYSLGKIPEEDYPVQRAILLQHGAAALRQLDAMQAQADEAADQDAEARLEAAVAARRADAAVRAVAGGNGHPAPLAIAAGPDDNLEAILASRRRERQEKSAGFCPKCGKPVQKSDRFCPKCGAKI